MKDKIVLAGGTGFLGKALAQFFAEKEYEVVVLGRSNELPADFPEARLVTWDARTIGSWMKELEGAKALVNLCGRSVDCRYNESNRRLILDSRVNATRVLGDAVAQATIPPKVWLNAGTATIYEDRRGDLPPHDENSDDLGHGFSVEVAKAWEEAFLETQVHHVRKVAMRISIVLGTGGGAFPVMCRFAQLGLGGRQGPGSQWMSWLHLDDWVGIVDWLVSTDSVSRVVNLGTQSGDERFLHERNAFCLCAFWRRFPGPSFCRSIWRRIPPYSSRAGSQEPQSSLKGLAGRGLCVSFSYFRGCNLRFVGITPCNSETPLNQLPYGRCAMDDLRNCFRNTGSGSNRSNIQNGFHYGSVEVWDCDPVGGGFAAVLCRGAPHLPHVQSSAVK